MNNRWIQGLTAAVPLLLTPGLFFMLAEGLLNLGGGEKDILIVFPYFLWALLFFITALALIIKGWSPLRWLRRSLTVSMFTMLVLWIVAFSISWFGWL